MRTTSKNVPGSYADCRQVCTHCRVGLSHAKVNRTFIREDWRAGLWRPQTAARLDRILDHALNEGNRVNKRRRMANERSEDLLTWNVFSWLEDHHLLGGLLTMIGLADKGSNVCVFYWGVNDRYSFPLSLPQLLTSTFGESERWLSEPDILLVGDSSLVVIEAKLGSPNNRSHGKSKPFDQYIKGSAKWFADPLSLPKTEYYELVRNWALGAAIAADLGKSLTLINLVPEHRERDIEQTFGPLLSGRGLFRRLTWEECARTLAPDLLPYLASETSYFKPAFPSLQAGPGK